MAKRNIGGSRGANARTGERTRDIASLAAGIVEPVLRRRAGLSMAIAAQWPAIVGPALADATRPLRIRWGRRAGPGEAASPGTLVVACSGATALRVQHEADQIVARVNAAFGHDAVARLRIEQRPVDPPAEPPAPPEPTARMQERAAQIAAPVENERLREALARLGGRVMAASSTIAASSSAPASTPPSNLHGKTIADSHTHHLDDATETDT